MQTHTSPYTLINKASSILMLLALIWLTVSIPFVYRAQQEAASKSMVSLSGGESNDDAPASSTSDNNPFANTTEEKPCGGVNTLTEEYLHAFHQDFTRHFSEVNVPAIHGHEATYEAFHGELLCPPPNQA